MVVETDLNTHMPNAVRGRFAEVLSRRAIDPFVRLAWDPAAINKGRRDEQSGTTVAMSRGMHRLLSNGCRDEDDHDDDDHDDDDDEELLNAPGETKMSDSETDKPLRISIITSPSPDGGMSWRKDWSNGMRGRRESARICRLRASSSDLRARMWHRQPLSQFSDLDAKYLPGSKLSLINFDAAVSNVESSKLDSDHRKTWREFCRSVIMRVCILQMDNVTVSSSGILNYTTSTV
ncbi:hypothetical protein ALC56_09821 [Trachymyrmex septentrionalis]|uniref:Uncharacterized protein n=1 Tax=Trachymyrmex septentrionalis TaxID=34720 RepID=A0A151JU77_9HYME|nr:hypothetical protein ALC56_09821 [Trachymyrmex septentrionalis]